MEDQNEDKEQQQQQRPLQQQTSASSSITSKWLGFVSALWVQAISGNNYTFSNYSVALKAIMGCNQVQLNGLSSAKDVGKAFGLFAGLLTDILPPWTILLIGSVEGLLGYGTQWLVVSQTIKPLPYWVMCIVMCMGGNSTTWMNTAVLVTCLRNFRRSRGPVSGILKAYVGLSTAIFTDLCAALFTSDPASFVLMLAVIPFAVCTIAMFFLKPVEPAHNPKEDQEERRCFAFLNTVAILLAVYLLAYDLSGIDNDVFCKVFAAGVLVILAIPAGLPVYLRIKVARTTETSEASQPLLEGKEDAQGHADRTESTELDLEKSDVQSKEEEEGAGTTRRRRRLGEDHTIKEALMTIDFWLLFVCFLCGVGTGMAVINNLGQIAESLGYTSAAIFISLTSIWGFFGRLGSGALSEFLIRWRRVPRPVVLAGSQVVMAIGYVILAAAVPGSLYVGSVVVGICYGVRLAVSVPVMSELFGLKIFGLVYNLLILNLPLGSFLFSSLLAGFLYDLEAAKESSTTCSGAHCYRMVFIIMAAVSTLGCLLDCVLALRSRSLYRSIQHSKLAKQ